MMNRSTFRNSAQPMRQCSMHTRGPCVLQLVRRACGEEGSEFFWGGGGGGVGEGREGVNSIGQPLF